MSVAPLLIEIGCEEIPARMIDAAAADLGARVLRTLDQAALEHGASRLFSGPRRLAVRIEAVQGRQGDREEEVLGPPARAAFSPDGEPTRAAQGFAHKHGIEPQRLLTIETERGSYVGFRRRVDGRTVGQVLAQALPAEVAAMSFPKSMRWEHGHHRWVRPVHWLVALHGAELLEVELFDIRAGRRSAGHRFLSGGWVEVPDADRYLESLRSVFVIADAEERRQALHTKLIRAATAVEATRLVEDPELLGEVADLVEWPGVVAGSFPDAFLEELPREIVETTLRHHQKSFALESGARPSPRFLAVANTDEDPKGHVRRGNEWVVNGRLEDALFFWREDRKRTLGEHALRLAQVTFHAKLGSYSDKAERTRRLAEELARRLGLAADDSAVGAAASLAKADLVTSLVGEFPELQGIVGGLLLRAEGEDESVATAVYEHYRPAGPTDRIPSSHVGCILSVADKLDTITSLLNAGETPTGSRDPFGLRRASNGLFRVLSEAAWPLSMTELFDITGQDPKTRGFLSERLVHFLRERGSTTNEIQAVLRPNVSEFEWQQWSLRDLSTRLDAIRAVRQREDFAHLADLTKRVDNILTKNSQVFLAASEACGGLDGYVEQEAAAVRLWELTERNTETVRSLEQEKRYDEVVHVLAQFIEPVERFFADVLVIDPEHPRAMLHRRELLDRLRGVLTRCFDIRELAGQAERRTG